MLNFIALYRGPTVKEAQIVAVSTDPQLIRHLAAGILSQSQKPGTQDADPVLAAVEEGRCLALTLIKDGDMA